MFLLYKPKSSLHNETLQLVFLGVTLFLAMFYNSFRHLLREQSEFASQDPEINQRAENVKDRFKNVAAKFEVVMGEGSC